MWRAYTGDSLSAAAAASVDLGDSSSLAPLSMLVLLLFLPFLLMRPTKLLMDLPTRLP